MRRKREKENGPEGDMTTVLASCKAGVMVARG